MSNFPESPVEHDEPVACICKYYVHPWVRRVGAVISRAHREGCLIHHIEGEQHEVATVHSSKGEGTVATSGRSARIPDNME